MRDIIKDSRRLPFCWQEKSALRLIQKYFEDNPKSTPSKPTVLAVYLALTWIASDNQNDSFQISVRSIANRAGLSKKSTKNCLHLLEKLGLLSIKRQEDETSKEQYTNIYELYNTDIQQTPDVEPNSHPRVLNTLPSGNNYPTPRVLNTPHIEEYNKEESFTKNNTTVSHDKIVFDRSNGEFRNISDSLLEKWKTAYPAVNIQQELAKASAWLMSNPKNQKKNYARFLTNWLSRAQERARRVGGPPKPAQDDIEHIIADNKEDYRELLKIYEKEIREGKVKVSYDPNINSW